MFEVFNPSVDVLGFAFGFSMFYVFEYFDAKMAVIYK